MIKINSESSKIIVKRILLIISSFLIIHLYHNRAVSIIEENLFVSPDFSSLSFDIFLIITTVLVALIFVFKYRKTEYKPSFNSAYLCLLVLGIFIYLFLKSESIGWIYLKDSILGCYYIFYLLFPLLFFLSYYLFIHIKAYFKKEAIYKSKYSNDDPISLKIQDQLDYKPYVENLTDFIKKESFGKSFSIALVGPWGNGKSSILNLVANELKTDNSFKDTLFIEFLPYLNHREDDIMNEFFVLLSNKLSNFNSKLSDQILNYSQKINDFYQGKNLIDFTNKPLNSNGELAAKELYDKIDESLKEVNKKIIVFIDDLDRLSGNEIIQVLKLIRNTANFRNTIFVVAMDKDYVIQRLKSSDKVLNSNYLEKFFQLEIYLPEIDKNTLQEYFIETFQNYLLDAASDFKRNLREALLSPSILFNDYIHNLRDVKRYSNQIKFDYPFIKNEIDLIDFINFTFLKTKFPNIVSSLAKNRSNLLLYNKGTETHYLEVLKENNDSKQEKSNLDIFFGFKNIATRDLQEFKKYKVFNEIIDKDCEKSIYDIDCDDRYLVMKTMSTLFGKKHVSNSKSIQLNNNLNIVLQRKIHSHVFTQNDYQELLAFENMEVLKNITSRLNKDKKISQFLKKLQWFEPNDSNVLKKIINILIFLYQNKNNYNLNNIEVESRLTTNAKELLKEKYGDSVKNSNWLWTEIFDGDYLDLESKILLLGNLWDAQHENGLWGFDKKQITAKAIGLYDSFLEKFRDKLWDVNDFRFYGPYHSLKNIDGVQSKINKSFINFWKKADIELLCAQILQPAAFSYTAFNISDVLIDIFRSKTNFLEFIEKNKSANKSVIIEFLEFLYLLKKTQFKIALDFKFGKSKLVYERIKAIEKNYKKNNIFDELKGITQVLIESNDSELLRRFIPYGHTKYNLIIVDNKNYSVMRANILKKIFRKDLTELLINISKTANDMGWNKDSYNEKAALNNEIFLSHNFKEDMYIKIIHPKPL